MARDAAAHQTSRARCHNRAQVKIRVTLSTLQTVLSLWVGIIQSAGFMLTVSDFLWFYNEWILRKYVGGVILWRLFDSALFRWTVGPQRSHELRRMPLSSCFCHLLLGVLDVLSEPIPAEQGMQPETIYSSFKVERLPERLKTLLTLFTLTLMVAEQPCKSLTCPSWPVLRRSQRSNCLISGQPAHPLEPQQTAVFTLLEW